VIRFSEEHIRILTYSVSAYAAYVDISKMATMRQCRNYTLLQYSYCLLANSYQKCRNFDVVAKRMASGPQLNNVIILGGGSGVYILGASGVAIAAGGGGTDLYCHSEPPLTSGKLCVIINFIGDTGEAGQNFYWRGRGRLPPSFEPPLHGAHVLENRIRVIIHVFYFLKNMYVF